MSRQKQFSMYRSAQRGFALIVVLGVLAVAALIVGTMIAQQENEATWSPVTGTKERLDEVQRALAAYERTEHRLPMPAVRTADGGLTLHAEALSLLQGSENDPHGYQLPSTVTNALNAGITMVDMAGGIVVASSDPTNLREIMIVGAVPTETLGLPREAAEDKNGHLLTYAVTFEMINRFTYSTSEGVIELKDTNNQVVADKLAYVMLSHGKNAKGAWSAKSRFKGRGCGTSDTKNEGQDYMNCTYEGASFVVKDLTLVRGDEYFDDQLLRGGKDRVAVSQNRPCIGPIDVTWVDDLCPGCTCQGTIPAPGLVSIDTHGTPKTIDLEDTTLSDIGAAQFTCNDGAASVVANSNTCTRPCILPWGGRIENGDSVEAYSVDSVACGETCPAPVMRVCMNGTLTGSGDHPSCMVLACAATGCALPWGGNLAEGASVQAYDASSVPCGESCNAHTRTCTGGVLSGSGNHQYCGDTCSGGCTLPWGGILNEGESVQAYSSDSVACGETCAATTRTCSGGTLTGGGNHDACTVRECGSCALPWGGTLANGASVQAYGSESVACGETCPAATTRTCTDGVLSGSGDHQACTVSECGTCALPWGGSIAEGASVQAYATRNVTTCTGTCPEPTTRTCTNGVLSGSGNWQSCSEEPVCAACSLPWGGTIAHGDSVWAYQAAQTSSCNGCNSERRLCTDGTLSGSYAFGTCADLTCSTHCGDCVDNGNFWTSNLCTGGFRWRYRCINGVNTEQPSGTGERCVANDECY